MRYLLTVILLLCFGTSQAANAKDVENILSDLSGMLDKRSGFIETRQAAIDSLVTEGRRNGFSSELLMKISDGYTSFNNDSALYYLGRGIESATGPVKMQFIWKRAALLPLAGFSDMAVREFNSINPDSIPAQLLPSYYEEGRQMHSYISAFFQSYPEVSEPHQRAALDLQEKLISILPPDSPAYKYNLGEYNLLTGRKETARVLLEEVVDNEPLTSNLMARAAHHLSTIANTKGDKDLYTYYLALSAMADLTAATREVVSLQELGNILYAHGDVNTAHKFLSNALANAVECGAPLRMLESSRSLPIIERAHSALIASWRSTMYWILAIISCLVVGLVATMIILHREMRKMERLQASLKAANTAKEVYISQFLQLCSIYMDKLNQFCKIATRKLAAGQSDELYRMTKSGKFVEEQSREFYEVFDNAFLHIYPDFVSQVNALLLPDQKIEVRPDQLNTDLRILAFMRLGIEESSRIAQVLNYSLNTIYAYRNRLKARAVDRDNFEDNIMKITSTF